MDKTTFTSYMETYLSENDVNIAGDLTVSGTMNVTGTVTAGTLNNAEMTQLRSDNATLTSENETLTSANQTLTSEKAALTTQNETLTSQNQTLTTANETLTSEKAALTTQNETLTSENETLTTQNETLTSENETLTADKATLEARVAELEAGGTAPEQAWAKLTSLNIFAKTYIPNYATQTDVSSYISWKTDDVVDMANCFAGCSELTSLDLSHWNFSNVYARGSSNYGLSGFVTGCTKLNLDFVNTMNIVPATNTEGLLSGLNKALDITNIAEKLSSFTSLANMFRSVSAIAGTVVTGKITGLDLIDTSNCTNMNSMFFKRNFQQSEIDLTSWNVSNVTDMQGMFQGTSQFTTLNLSGWTLKDGVNLANAFRDIGNNTTINLSGWDFTKISSSTDAVFYNSYLYKLILKNAKWSDKINAYYNNQPQIWDIEGFDTSAVTKFNSVLFAASANITLENEDKCVFDFANATNITNCFKNVNRANSSGNLCILTVKNVPSSLAADISAFATAVNYPEEQLVVQNFLPAE